MIAKRILASKTVWRLTGATYTTAVMATHGRYVPISEYLDDCSTQMELLQGVMIGRKNVLEFGCGLGGNLLSISDNTIKGVGLDVNPGYLRIAKRIAKRCRISNVDFILYDGLDMSDILLDRPDLVFTIGVFERIPKEQVLTYLRWLSILLIPGGRLISYFLTDRARNSAFTRRLGDGSYVYWSSSELREIGTKLEMDLVEKISWPACPFIKGGSGESFADVLVLDKPLNVGSSQNSRIN